MTVNKKQPNPIDIHVGGRIRLRRTMLGMSQEKLGEHLGITFQQVQKYEAGVNRVAASRLWIMAEALQVPITYFFEGLETPADTGQAESASDTTIPDTTQLIKIFERLPPEQKSAMSSFLLSLDSARN